MEPCKYIPLQILGLSSLFERPQQENKFIQTHRGMLGEHTSLTGVSVSDRTLRRSLT